MPLAPGAPGGPGGPPAPAGGGVAAKRGKVKVTCTVRFKAAAGSTRLRARLARGHRVYASGARAVRRGARGRISLHAHRRIARGRYTLLLTFADQRGHQSVIRQRVRIR